MRGALEFGPIAPQSPPVPGAAIPGDPQEQDEDCLTLNVWTPALDGRRRPVMVWIHGGGFTTGTGGSSLYAGDRLAREADVVVVTCNYRLGALGFLAHGALGEGGSPGTQGNWGLLDQIAVLHWVRRHIGSFGGDAGNVTLFGESAGGMSVSALLGAPRARGLFHKAIIQSGPPYSHTPARAQRAAEDLAEILGIGSLNRSTLEAVPAQDLVAAAQTMQGRVPEPGELPLPFLPVVDGIVLPQAPEAAVASGEAAPVPLIIGSNRDELTFFGMADPRLAIVDDQGLHSALERALPGVEAGEAVECYRTAREARAEPVDPRSVWVAMGSDIVFRWPSLRLAATQRIHQSATFVYLFTWPSPAFGGVLGSCHALEIPFVFGSFEHPFIGPFVGMGPAAARLSGAMRHAWATFARTGQPHVDGGPPWQPWDPNRRATMVFGETSGPEDGPRDQELAAWAASTPLHGQDGVVGTTPECGRRCGDGDVAQPAEAGRLKRSK